MEEARENAAVDNDKEKDKKIAKVRYCCLGLGTPFVSLSDWFE